MIQNTPIQCLLTYFSYNAVIHLHMYYNQETAHAVLVHIMPYIAYMYMYIAHPQITSSYVDELSAVFSSQSKQGLSMHNRVLANILCTLIYLPTLYNIIVSVCVCVCVCVLCQSTQQVHRVMMQFDNSWTLACIFWLPSSSYLLYLCWPACCVCCYPTASLYSRYRLVLRNELSCIPFHVEINVLCHVYVMCTMDCSI